MKNICQIFITDFKRIKTNVVAVVIMLGLIILPSLYAWFNILSNWAHMERRPHPRSRLLWHPMMKV
ncbi:MAG: hypothetical protein V8S90_02950 [Lachnospiraceae bacterium]